SAKPPDASTPNDFSLRSRPVTRQSLREAVRDDFPHLPSGCHIELDRVSKDIVLANLKNTLPTSKAGLVSELRHLGDVSLATFLRETGLEIEDVYRSASLGGWTGLRRLADIETSAPSEDDRELGRAIGRMLHTDDTDRLELLTRVAAGPPAPGQQVYAGNGRLLNMLHFSLWGPSAPLATREERLARLWKEPARCAELQQVAEVLRDRIHRVTPAAAPGAVPLRVHARYSRNEACAAFGMPNPGSLREGVKWLPDAQADLFFVTLVKSEAHYSPTTMYADRAITDTLFQWESQSTTSAASATGQRYTSGTSTVHLFVRETRVADRDLGAPPYLYAGTMTYESHTGDRPMRILWRLHQALPADVYATARAIAA
ncbi:DUF3427 domain-containing protein, partial [Micromonospora sp. DT4]|uniref:DUF3427 domain-containing protein n=1 Tax=Micromonospora sp. DT4 TaxID=3393438 RepID=UPI003CEF5D31